MSTQQIVLTLVVSYLIGSIPVSYLVGKLHGIDIFTIGSGNMGATNVARAVSKKWGLFAWLLDTVKGIGAVLVARQLVTDFTEAVTIFAAVGVVAGHNWSFFVLLITRQLRGGKGAAAALGSWVWFIPPLFFIIAVSVWVALLVKTRYMSLAVITMNSIIALVVIGMVVEGAEQVHLVYLVATAMIIFRHRDNIQRLLSGTERRFGEKAAE